MVSNRLLQVNIELMNSTVEPGMNATLRVTGPLHSTISLLAVDRSKILRLLS